MTKQRFKVGDEVLVARKSSWHHWVRDMDSLVGRIFKISREYGEASGQYYYAVHGKVFNFPDDCFEFVSEEAKAQAAAIAELERLKELPNIIDDLNFTDVRGKAVEPKTFTKAELIEVFERKRKSFNGPTSWATKGNNDGPKNKNDFLLMGDNACHAQVWEKPIKNFMLNQFKLDYYNTARPVSEFQKSCDKWYYEKYLFHPKYSPWKDTIQDFILIRNPKLGNMPIGFLVEGGALNRIDKKMFGNLCIATRHPYEYPMFITSMFNINKHVDYKPISFVLSRHINFTLPEMTDLKINPSLMYTGHQHIAGNKFVRLLKKAPGIIGVKYPMDKQCSYYADKEIWQGTSKIDTKSGDDFERAFENILKSAKTETRGSRFSNTKGLPVTELAGIGAAIKELVNKYTPDDTNNNKEEEDPDAYEDDDEYHDDDYDDEGHEQ